MNEDTKQYQITMVFPPSLNPEKLKNTVEKTKQIIINQQGVISPDSEALEPQLKKLSYPINKHQEAFYLTLNFSMTAQGAEELNYQLNLENNLIRHIITTQDKIKKQKEDKQAVDYSKMIEKVEPISPEPLLKTKKEVPEKVSAPKTPKAPKAEIEDLDKKLEEILSE